MEDEKTHTYRVSIKGKIATICLPEDVGDLEEGTLQFMTKSGRCVTINLGEETTNLDNSDQKSSDEVGVHIQSNSQDDPLCMECVNIDDENQSDSDHDVMDAVDDDDDNHHDSVAMETNSAEPFVGDGSGIACEPQKSNGCDDVSKSTDISTGHNTLVKSSDDLEKHNKSTVPKPSDLDKHEQSQECVNDDPPRENSVDKETAHDAVMQNTEMKVIHNAESKNQDGVCGEGSKASEVNNAEDEAEGSAEASDTDLNAEISPSAKSQLVPSGHDKPENQSCELLMEVEEISDHSPVDSACSSVENKQNSVISSPTEEEKKKVTKSLFKEDKKSPTTSPMKAGRKINLLKSPLNLSPVRVNKFGRLVPRVDINVSRLYRRWADSVKPSFVKLELSRFSDSTPKKTKVNVDEATSNGSRGEIHLTGQTRSKTLECRWADRVKPCHVKMDMMEKTRLFGLSPGKTGVSVGKTAVNGNHVDIHNAAAAKSRDHCVSGHSASHDIGDSISVTKSGVGRTRGDTKPKSSNKHDKRSVHCALSGQTENVIIKNIVSKDSNSSYAKVKSKHSEEKDAVKLAMLGNMLAKSSKRYASVPGDIHGKDPAGAHQSSVKFRLCSVCINRIDIVDKHAEHLMDLLRTEHKKLSQMLAAKRRRERAKLARKSKEDLKAVSGCNSKGLCTKLVDALPVLAQQHPGYTFTKSKHQKRTDSVSAWLHQTHFKETIGNIINSAALQEGDENETASKEMSKNKTNKDVNLVTSGLSATVGDGGLETMAGGLNSECKTIPAVIGYQQPNDLSLDGVCDVIDLTHADASQILENTRLVAPAAPTILAEKTSEGMVISGEGVLSIHKDVFSSGKDVLNSGEGLSLEKKQLLLQDDSVIIYENIYTTVSPPANSQIVPPAVLHEPVPAHSAEKNSTAEVTQMNHTVSDERRLSVHRADISQDDCVVFVEGIRPVLSHTKILNEETASDSPMFTPSCSPTSELDNLENRIPYELKAAFSSVDASGELQSYFNLNNTEDSMNLQKAAAQDLDIMAGISIANVCSLNPGATDSTFAQSTDRDISETDFPPYAAAEQAKSTQEKRKRSSLKLSSKTRETIKKRLQKHVKHKGSECQE